MVKKNGEKWFWRLWHDMSPSQAPRHVERLNYRIHDFTDQDLYWLTRRVKSIGQLDLDETFVGNEGVKHLADLESLIELRLKNLEDVDDECIPYLNQITSLETLHLGGTQVTAKGALGLNALTRLKLLLLPEQKEDSHQYLLQLSEMFPDCEFIVNYRRFEPDA